MRSWNDVVGLSHPDHHYYYTDPKTIDLNKIREECNARSDGKYFGLPPHKSYIHYHKYGELCKGKEHEAYAPRRGE
jgi:hypothetical protein